MHKRTAHKKKGVKRKRSKVVEYVSFSKFLKIVAKRKQDVFTAPPLERPEPVRKGKYIAFKDLVTKIKKNKIAREKWGRKVRRKPAKKTIKKKVVKKKSVKRKVNKRKTLKRKRVKKKTVKHKTKKILRRKL